MKDGPQVALLEVDRELGAELEGQARDRAQTQLKVKTGCIEPGVYDASSVVPASAGYLGVLVFEGLFMRDVAIAETQCAELIGAGDLLRPWEDIGVAAPIPTAVEWQVIEPTRLAVLDHEFVRSAAQWPEVLAALTLRAVTRAQTLGLLMAITCITGLSVRVLAVLWHLADRFGHVGREGVAMPVALTHEMVARLIGAKRPSVSTAFGELEREGAVSRRGGGGYLLHGEPPEMVRLMASRRLAAREARRFSRARKEAGSS